VRKGFLTAGIGQLPLTLLISIIAVTYLSGDLIPDRPAPSITSLGISIGLMNILGSFFGSMPICHGSGGLAGQYRFGARSGASVMILGVVKIILGFAFGSTFTSLLVQFPKSLLAVLVFAAGAELAKVGEDLNSSARDLWTTSQGSPYFSDAYAREEPRLKVVGEKERKERFMVMLVTAGTVIAVRNDAVGLLAGSICWLGFLGQAWINEKAWHSWEVRSRMRSWSFDWNKWRQPRPHEQDPLLSS